MLIKFQEKHSKEIHTVTKIRNLGQWKLAIIINTEKAPLIFYLDVTSPKKNVFIHLVTWRNLRPIFLSPFSSI